MFSLNDIQLAEIRRAEAQLRAGAARRAAYHRGTGQRATGRRITQWAGRRLVLWGTWLEQRSREWERNPQPLYNGANNLPAVPNLSVESR